MQEFSNLSNEELNLKFIEACYYGDFKAVHYLSTVKKVDIYCEIASGLREACEKGHVDIVRFLTSSKELEKPIDILTYKDGIKYACLEGQIPVVEFLLESNILDIHYRHEYLFRAACQGNQLELVEYLLSSPKLKEHADIHYQDEACFRSACENNQLPMVKLLIDLSLKSKPINVRAIHDQAFKTVCELGHIDIVKYFLEECPLKATAPKIIEAGFLLACLHGQTEVVKYLVNSTNVNIYAKKGQGFFVACLNKHEEMINYFLYDTEYKIKLPLKKQLDKLANPDLDDSQKLELKNSIFNKIKKRDLFVKINNEFEPSNSQIKRHKL